MTDRTNIPPGWASEADSTLLTKNIRAFSFAPMNVECRMNLRSRRETYKASISDCCPMGMVNIHIDDETEGGLELELDISVDDAECLIDALRLIISRRRI